MKKKSSRKLMLNRETLRYLAETQLQNAAGATAIQCFPSRHFSCDPDSIYCPSQRADCHFTDYTCYETCGG